MRIITKIRIKRKLIIVFQEWRCVIRTNGGIDIEEYEQRKIAGLSTVSRKSCGIPESAFVVGMVGRISEQKAPDVFIKAAKQIKQKIPEACFMIVGDGPDREYGSQRHWCG